MGLIIKCPYYVADKRKTISCEGCLKHFIDTDKKNGYLKNVCMDNFKGCKYYQDLQTLYKEIAGDRKNADILRARFYLKANKHEVKHLIQQQGIMEKNIAANITTKQLEIDKLRGMLKAAQVREQVALTYVAAIMHHEGMEEFDLRWVTELRSNYNYIGFEPTSVNEQKGRLVLAKEAIRNGIDIRDSTRSTEKISETGGGENEQ